MGRSSTWLGSRGPWSSTCPGATEPRLRTPTRPQTRQTGRPSVPAAVLEDAVRLPGVSTGIIVCRNGAVSPPFRHTMMAEACRREVQLGRVDGPSSWARRAAPGSDTRGDERVREWRGRSPLCRRAGPAGVWRPPAGRPTQPLAGPRGQSWWKIPARRKQSCRETTCFLPSSGDFPLKRQAHKGYMLRNTMNRPEPSADTAFCWMARWADAGKHLRRPPGCY